MGFQSTATSITLTAKLTPLGRQLMVTNTNNLITKFALGDTDANYNSPLLLETGEVPSMGGEVGVNNTTSNSVGADTAIKYPLFVNSVGGNTKGVDPNSVTVASKLLNNGQVAGISGSNITYFAVDRNDYETDKNVNLFSSFGLPITETDKKWYTATTYTYAKGGYSDTAISGFAADKIVVIGLDGSLYGETLDGKEIMLNIETSASSYTLYSTFENKNISLRTEDANYKETSKNTLQLGKALSFLMCDAIKQPNGDVTKSWATGFGDTKPYSVGYKQLYNFRTNENLGLTADSVCGIAYLDKGILVITEPTIVNDFNASYSGVTGTSVTVNSVSTDVVQNVTCVAGRGEFGSSSNPSWSVGDPVRITEIGLYDNLNRLIAYGKFDRQVEKTTDGFMSFGINIRM